jgi:nitrous oxide reductase accessory protein NosL
MKDFRKGWLILFMLGAIYSVSHAEMKCAPGKCGGMTETKSKAGQNHSKMLTCSVCGMKLRMFPHTSHKAKVNGKTKYYCSIHCVEADIRKGVDLQDVRVKDAQTLEYIDAQKAYYVITKGKRGTMTMTGKSAFSSKEAAEAYAKEYDGYITDFAGALKEADKDFETK